MDEFQGLESRSSFTFDLMSCVQTSVIIFSNFIPGFYVDLVLPFFQIPIVDGFNVSMFVAAKLF